MKNAMRMLLLGFACLVLGACGKGDKNSKDESSALEAAELAIANEAYFVWNENLIIELTSEGQKQEALKIPARCEGFSGFVFDKSKVEYVTFEDDDDVALEKAFMGAKRIKYVSLPKNLKEIPIRCFMGCESLQSIHIPANVETIGDFAFQACSNLEEVIFEGGALTVIPSYCFDDCVSLKRVELSDKVTTIKNSAFSHCSELTKMTFCDSVHTIEENAFYSTGITEICFSEGVELIELSADAFGKESQLIKVCIKKDSWCDKNQNKWAKGFNEIIVE